MIDVVPGLCDGLLCAMAVVDLPPTPLRVREATVDVGLDGLAYLSFDLEDGGLGWTGGLPTLDPAAYDRAHAGWPAGRKRQAPLAGRLPSARCRQGIDAAPRRTDAPAEPVSPA